MVEQLVRPTGLVDPTLDVRPAATQVDDLLSEIRLRVERNERVLVTTLTKRMAEDPHRLSRRKRRQGALPALGHRNRGASEIICLRLGEFDVVVGINCCEGLDIPEVLPGDPTQTRKASALGTLADPNHARRAAHQRHGDPYGDG